MSVLGETVMITGASRGIGEAAAHAFAHAGANVVLLARGQDAVAKIARDIGEAAMAIACDVSQFQEVQAAVACAESRFGPVDILINNAGALLPIDHIATSDPEGWGRVIDVNLKGVYHCVRAVLPSMLERAAGTILNLSSGAAYSPVEAWSHYCASKAGALMLTRSIDQEYRDKGIRALGLSPGTVATEMQGDIKASGINPVSRLEWSDHVPPEWPAKALLWMCGAEADAFLGEDIILRDEDIRARLGLVA
ncbi:MAG: SDR family oxidoreductase [Boseongicola sp.]